MGISVALLTLIESYWPLKPGDLTVVGEAVTKRYHALTQKVGKEVYSSEMSLMSLSIRNK